jgi:hypothetical protein
MPTDLHWIDGAMPGRLAIMARPRAGDWLADEIAGWRAADVGIVVSLLEPHESAELGLAAEGELCRRAGMDFISFPIADRGVPDSLRRSTGLARQLAHDLAAGKAIAVHCRAGIGRSALMAACALVCRGLTPDTAFTAIAAARGLPVPDTEAQVEWVRVFSETLDERLGSVLDRAAER